MMLNRRVVGLTCIVSALAGSACSETPLLDVRPEPKGTNCPAGGNAVLAGVDRNHNGKLDAPEVSSTRYVCDGANGVDGANGIDGSDGKSSLIRAVSEPVGIACPTGGAKFSTGLDVDGDGVLAKGEVTSVQFICNGAAGKNGADGLDSLVEVLALEPEGDSCPSGGQAIYSGRDLDADGLLDPAEVEHTAFVCNASDGLDALVQQAPEAAGANCEFGGVRLDSGLDTDRDGELCVSEATQTSFVCHGAPGAAAHSSLVAVIEEAPGAHCVAGGARVDTGLDLDLDGLLSSTEVTGTSYICSGAPGPAGGSGANGSLLQRLQWAPAACATGGVRVDSGIDADGNGALDESEVTGTFYVCNAELPWSHAGIAVGDSHACLPQSDGVVTCWGNNSDGQLGDNTFVARAEPGSSVPGLGSVAFVATGGNHSCAIIAGRVQCWGEGPLGDATPNSSATPVGVLRVGGGHPPSSSVPFDGAVALSLGERHSCALRIDGTVWCWGDNSVGQLGHAFASASGFRAQAVVVGGPNGPLGSLTGAVAIASGNAHSCALLGSGQVYCWGAQVAGQLGNDTLLASSSALPVRVSALGSDADTALSNVAAIDAGGDHSCAALKDGSVRCWGRNAAGELGSGDTLPLRFASTAIPGITTARALATGRDHSCALLSDASVRCWGANQAGQLGDGSFEDSLVPVPVSTSNVIAALDAGPSGATTCARLLDGRALCWGAGSDGELGTGLPMQDSPVPVAVKSIH